MRWDSVVLVEWCALFQRIVVPSFSGSNRMKVLHSFEIPETTGPTTQHHMPEDINADNFCYLQI
jgi:hypothetical protein